MAMISVRGLCKQYANRTGVADVSFDVERGEIFGILGPNGAGKTTTVECIGGLRRRDSGEIAVAGFDPALESDGLRRVLGIQLQESRFPDKLTVAEAIRLYASFYPNPVDGDELIERLGLAEQRRTYYSKLSGGQKQRLSVAVALVGRPQVAILDELTTGLDPQARRDVWSLLEEMRGFGVTLLLVPHFMEEAERLCDRVAVIDGGRVVALDTPRRLATNVASGQRMIFTPSTLTTGATVANSGLDFDELRAIPSVSSVIEVGEQTVAVAGGDDMVTDVVLALAARGIRARRMRLEQANLEDAFVSITQHADDTRIEDQRQGATK